MAELVEMAYLLQEKVDTWNDR